MGGEKIVPVTPPVEEGGRGPGQLPGMCVQALADSLVDGGQQVGVFVDEPLPRLFLAGELLHEGPGFRGAGNDGISPRVDTPFRGERAVQIVVERAMSRSVPVARGVLAGRLLR